MNSVIRRWLAKSPRVLAAYLVGDNRRRTARGRRFLIACALLGAAIIILVGYLSRLAWPARHGLFLAGSCALAACVLVARRRAVQRAEAARSWIAALPVESSIARWTTLAMELAPSLMWICLFMVTAPFSTGLAMSGGVAFGALVSYWAPAPTAIEPAPGSRYVPHRRSVQDPFPRGSLSALGAWPVRRMFASARPKAVARATIPVLVMMPMGASADSAMLVIGIFAVVGAFALLLSAVIAVNGHASRWLLPLPLAASVLTRHVLARSLAVMLGMAATEAWLVWVMKSSAQ
jgi:hypothetical protein